MPKACNILGTYRTSVSQGTTTKHWDEVTVHSAAKKTKTKQGLKHSWWHPNLSKATSEELQHSPAAAGVVLCHLHNPCWPLQGNIHLSINSSSIHHPTSSHPSIPASLVWCFEPCKGCGEHQGHPKSISCRGRASVLHRLIHLGVCHHGMVRLEISFSSSTIPQHMDRIVCSQLWDIPSEGRSTSPLDNLLQPSPAQGRNSSSISGHQLLPVPPVPLLGPCTQDEVPSQHLLSLSSSEMLQHLPPPCPPALALLQELFLS